MKRILAGCTAALALAVLSPATALAAGPTTRVVDDDGAQCAKAEFRTIGAAVAAANPGDTIRVCAGVYRERVEVNKQVQLIGQRDAVERVKCVDQTWTSTDAVDPAAFPVIEPPDGQVGSLVRLQADGIELAGFVVQGQKDPGADGNIYAPAIQADGARSSHRIHHNLIQNNTFGIELGSNGATLSQVDHNCLRGNNWAVANQRYTTANIRVDHNEVFRTGVTPFEVGWSVAGISNARYDHNRSVGSGWAEYTVERAEAVTLDHNTAEAPNTYGIFVQGANKNVAITNNRLSGTPTSAVGIAVSAPSPQAPQPSSGIVIANNAAERFTVGILVGLNAHTTGTQVLSNVTLENRISGIQVGETNTSALVKGNTSNHNGYGIRTSTPRVKGNTFVGNSMHDNTGFDAVELGFTTVGGITTLNNTWQDNNCNTDSPTGTICVH